MSIIWSYELSAELCKELPYNPKPETKKLLLSQPVVVSTTDSSHHHNSTPRDTEICSRYWLFNGSPWILSSLMASHYNYNILKSILDCLSTMFPSLTINIYCTVYEKVRYEPIYNWKLGALIIKAHICSEPRSYHQHKSVLGFWNPTYGEGLVGVAVSTFH